MSSRHLVEKLSYLLWSCVCLATAWYLQGPLTVEAGSTTAGERSGLHKAYIEDPETESVAVFDLLSKSVIKKIPLEGEYGGLRDDRRGVAISPDGHYAYMSNHRSASVSVIDTAKDEVIQKIDLSLPDPGNVSIAADGHSLYIPHYSAKAMTLLKIPENTQLVIQLDGFPGDIVDTGNGRNILITSRNSNTLIILDLTTLHLSSLEVGLNPVAIDVTPDGNEAYVSHDNDRFVSVIDLTATPFKVKETIPVSMTGGASVAVTPDGQYVLVAHCCANSAVSVITTRTKSVRCLVSLTPDGLDPVRILFTPDDKEALIINSQSRNISIIRPPCGEPTTQNPFEKMNP
jgi:YVTN family beta-propeller protein